MEKQNNSAQQFWDEQMLLNLGWVREGQNWRYNDPRNWYQYPKIIEEPILSFEQALLIEKADKGIPEVDEDFLLQIPNHNEDPNQG